MEVTAFGDESRTNYVSVVDERDLTTVYGRDAGGAWSVVAAGVDDETAEEVRLWFDLTQHYGFQTPGSDAETGHPLDGVSTPEDEQMPAERAIRLVVERIQARGLDYPVQGLVADRFKAGWSVYAPVDIDDSDPMAFRDMPVGRSVFLVSDAGRIKETSSSIPPPAAEGMFTAEEAYVRRPLAGENSMADLWNEAMRLDSASDGPLAIASFTIDTPDEAIAERASALLAPITQQVAQLGPPGWDRFSAVFSFTVGAEVAQLQFWSGNQVTDARVPEQIALLVRRQRHLAARMPAGPWWRLLLSVNIGAGTGAQLSTDYDYGDRPFPDDHLLAADHYRDDLAAYPRPHTPAWLTEHIANADKPAPRTTPPATGAKPQNQPLPSQASDARPAAVAPHNIASPSGDPSNPMASPRPSRPGTVPRLDTTADWTRLQADPQTITYGKKSIALDQVEWVSYTATQVAEKRFLFPTFYQNYWTFHVGQYPYYSGHKVAVSFSKGGRHAEQPQGWTFLINLSKQYLEPRLLDDLITRVRRGETITVAGSVEFSQDGIACTKPRFSLPWASISPPTLHNGIVSIHQTGVEKPVVTAPLSHPNAVLIPDLFNALAP
ncbi:hypothetical protein [Stackebrandtia soli]|uniref:hypothetical protein n=1 Tax=Stackebrandtia soli TaxID=1892856 RepID=UPI0039E7702B